MPKISKKLAIYLFVACSLFAVAFRYSLSLDGYFAFHQLPQGDEEPYLENAIKIRENGWQALFVKNGYDDRYHPLHAIINSFWADRSFAFFGRARLFSYLVGLLILFANFFFVMYFLRGYPYNYIVALLSDFLLAKNSFFLDNTSSVMVDPLLALFVLLFFYSLLLFSSHPTLCTSVLLGLFLALAYLTKGTATIFVLVLLVVLFLSRGRLFKSTVKLATTIICWFLLFSAPFLWRNAYLYDNPFYSYSTGKALWLDSWTQTYDVDFEKQEIGLGPYLRTHAVSEMVHRFYEGLNKQSELVIRILSPFEGFIAGGTLFLVLFFLGIYILEKKRLVCAVIGMSFALLFLSFSWYKAAISPRFYAPILPLMINVVSFSLVEFSCHTYSSLAGMSRRLKGLFTPAMSLILLGACSLLIVRAGISGQFLNIENIFIKEDDDYRKLRLWFLENIVSADDIYLHGPDHNFQFEWQTGTGKYRKRLPKLQSVSEFAGFLEDERIKYFLLTDNLFGERSEVIKSCLVEATVPTLLCRPANWEVLMTGTILPNGLPKYVLFKINQDQT